MQKFEKLSSNRDQTLIAAGSVNDMVRNGWGQRNVCYALRLSSSTVVQYCSSNVQDWVLYTYLCLAMDSLSTKYGTCNCVKASQGLPWWMYVHILALILHWVAIVSNFLNSFCLYSMHCNGICTRKLALLCTHVMSCGSGLVTVSAKWQPILYSTAVCADSTVNWCTEVATMYYTNTHDCIWYVWLLVLFSNVFWFSNILQQLKKAL